MSSVEVLERENITEIDTVITADEKKITDPNVPQLDFEYKEKSVFHAVKRTFDVIASLCALILLSPLFLIVIVAIMIIDFGNPFFAQIRIGKDGKAFKMYKFRSMYKDAEARKDALRQHNQCDGALFKIDNDPRVLGKFGKFIRKSSIDELPQLVNILKGDMSVIGPRPFVPDEQEKLAKERLFVKPGLSCYWQINGKNSLSEEMAMYYDKKYIMDRSVTTDLKIIIKTFGVIFKSSNS